VDNIDGTPQRYVEAPNQENTKSRKEREMKKKMYAEYEKSFWVENPEQEYSFAFVEEDSQVTQALAQSLRIISQCPYLQPEKRDSIQKAIEAVERMPQITPSFCIIISLTLHYLDSDWKEYYEVVIASDCLCILSGKGFVFDTYEDKYFLIERNGYHEIDHSIMRWFVEVEEAMEMIRKPLDWHLTWSLSVEDSSVEHV